MSPINFSIIIPAYNVEEYIEECLNSFKTLIDLGIEILVVDDGSTDRTKEKLENYSKVFDHFFIFEQENQGASVARNKALEHAKGKYIFFCDSDDYVDPIELREFFNETLHLDVDVSMGNGRNLTGSTLGPVLKTGSFRKSLGVVDGPSFYLQGNEKKEFQVNPVICLYRRSFLDSNHLRFFPKVMHEDEEFAPKVFCLAKKVVYLEKYFYIRRHRVGSVTKNTRHKYFNAQSSPAFQKLFFSLVNFLGTKELNSSQKAVITHSILKCNLEILRRELYYAKEGIKEMKMPGDMKISIENALKKIDMNFQQKLEILRIKSKIRFYNLLKPIK